MSMSFDPGLMSLEELDAFLMSDDAPDNCMMLSDLDGYLTAVAIGPELIMPSEWLPHVWGGASAEFKSEDQARRVLGAIMGLPRERKTRSRRHRDQRQIQKVCLADELVQKLGNLRSTSHCRSSQANLWMSAIPRWVETNHTMMREDTQQAAGDLPHVIPFPTCPALQMPPIRCYHSGMKTVRVDLPLGGQCAACVPADVGDCRDA